MKWKEGLEYLLYIENISAATISNPYPFPFHHAL